MSESSEQTGAEPGENPSSEELEVEAPNESAPGHNPEEGDPGEPEQDPPPGASS